MFLMGFKYQKYSPKMITLMIHQMSFSNMLMPYHRFFYKEYHNFIFQFKSHTNDFSEFVFIGLTQLLLLISLTKTKTSERREEGNGPPNCKIT